MVVDMPRVASHDLDLDDFVKILEKKLEPLGIDTKISEFEKGKLKVECSWYPKDARVVFTVIDQKPCETYTTHMGVGFVTARRKF